MLKHLNLIDDANQIEKTNVFKQQWSQIEHQASLTTYQSPLAADHWPPATGLSPLPIAHCLLPKDEYF